MLLLTAADAASEDCKLYGLYAIIQIVDVVCVRMMAEHYLRLSDLACTVPFLRGDQLEFTEEKKKESGRKKKFSNCSQICVLFVFKTGNDDRLLTRRYPFHPRRRSIGKFGDRVVAFEPWQPLDCCAVRSPPCCVFGGRSFSPIHERVFRAVL